MENIRIALISDIHGNRLALEAVLERINKCKVDFIINLGDSFYGPIDPAGTADILVSLEIVSILGNEDILLLNPPYNYSNKETLDFTLCQLSNDHLDWLKSLKPTAVYLDQFLACHGTPESDHEYLFWKVEEQGAVLRGADELEQRWGSYNKHILCGHDHVPNFINTKSGRIFINPGSVGLPAYTDDLPYPHRMESGSPHARFSIVTSRGRSFNVDNIIVEYDWRTAASCARKNGRVDWAAWLLSGRTG